MTQAGTGIGGFFRDIGLTAANQLGTPSADAATAAVAQAPSEAEVRSALEAASKTIGSAAKKLAGRGSRAVKKTIRLQLRQSIKDLSQGIIGTAEDVAISDNLLDRLVRGARAAARQTKVSSEQLGSRIGLFGAQAAAQEAGVTVNAAHRRALAAFAGKEAGKDFRKISGILSRAIKGGGTRLSRLGAAASNPLNQLKLGLAPALLGAVANSVADTVDTVTGPGRRQAASNAALLAAQQDQGPVQQTPLDDILNALSSNPQATAALRSDPRLSLQLAERFQTQPVDPLAGLPRGAVALLRSGGGSQTGLDRERAIRLRALLQG